MTNVYLQYLSTQRFWTTIKFKSFRDPSNAPGCFLWLPKPTTYMDFSDAPRCFLQAYLTAAFTGSAMLLNARSAMLHDASHSFALIPLNSDESIAGLTTRHSFTFS